jgi:hypothetical protein
MRGAFDVGLDTSATATLRVRFLGLRSCPTGTTDASGRALLAQARHDRFVGCGEDAIAPLTNMFPDAVMPSASPDKTRVSWPAVPNDGFLVSVAGELTGELCRTEPDAASQAIWALLDHAHETREVRILGAPTSPGRIADDPTHATEPQPIDNDRRSNEQAPFTLCGHVHRPEPVAAHAHGQILNVDARVVILQGSPRG